MPPSARGFVLSLCVAAATLCANSASALIVWNGKVVSKWPEEARPVPAGAALAVQNIGLYPHPKGTVYGLTLLIDFADASPAFTKPEIDAWLNQQGYAEDGLNGSVRDYYADVSNGMVDFENEIFGFYRAKQSKAYYEGRPGYSGSDELFEELMDYFDASIDFSKYDNDEDGKTDAISIVYAGEAETWGQGLWPHASGSNQKRDGVTISRYMMTNLGKSLGLYTFAHEVGHMLFGWPDLYGFGNYCLMGNSSSPKNPVGINDFYRADQGWIPLVDVTAETNALFSAEVDGAGYRYQNPARPEESFFWSNVQSSGRFSTISGDGLLLLHFDHEIRSNSPPEPLSLAVVQADGKKELDETMWPMPGSDADDYFHAGGVSEFSEQKFETARWNDGTSSELHIYEVAAIGPSMSFKVGNGPIVVEPTAGSGGAAGSSGAGSGGSSSSASGAAGSAGAGTGPGGASNAGAGGVASSMMAGQAGLASSGTGGKPLGSAPPADNDSACSCRLGTRGHERGGVLAGLAALLLWRRRRS